MSRESFYTTKSFQRRYYNEKKNLNSNVRQTSLYENSSSDNLRTLWHGLSLNVCVLTWVYTELLQTVAAWLSILAA